MLSSVDEVELMQKIPRKVHDIEGIKEEYQRKKDKLDAKYQAELAGIEDKIGQILEVRVEEFNIALEILEATKDEVKKAQQRLAQTKEYMAQTKSKARKSIEDAQRALKKATDAEIETIQKEIRVAQKRIRENEKSLRIAA